MNHCIICSRRHWSGKDLELAGTTRHFCLSCWTELAQVMAKPQEEAQRRDDIFDAIRGYTDIVINRCHGGFGLSTAAKMRYLELAGVRYDLQDRESRDQTHRYGPLFQVNGAWWDDYVISRDDPLLVTVVREMKQAANGTHAELKIVRIPDGVAWDIDEYDGIEIVRELHRTWV